MTQPLSPVRFLTHSHHESIKGSLTVPTHTETANICENCSRYGYVPSQKVRLPVFVPARIFIGVKLLRTADFELITH
jgi:hypothetical protein